jgi:PAS domain S-box-containing protein
LTNIGTKLGLGTGTLLAVGLVIGIVSYLQNASVHDRLDELTSVREPVNTTANELKKKVSEAASATLGYFMTGDTTLRNRLRQSRKEFTENRASFLALLNRATDGLTASGLLDRFMAFYALAEDQIGLRDEQSRQMRELLSNLDGIDALLKDRIAASVRSDDPIAYRRLQVALEMQIQMNAMVKGLGNYLITGEERFRKDIADARTEFSHFLQVYQVVLLSPEEKSWAAELIRRSDRSIAMASSVSDLQERRLAKMTMFMAQYGELGSLIEDPLLRNTATDLAGAKTALIEAGERANSTIMAVLLAGMAFGIGAAIVTTRRITSPLRHLVSVMNAAGHEGPVREIELQTSDEFRQVGDSFNMMMRRLATANTHLREEIAERQKAEESLRESELRFRTIFEDAPIGIALADGEGTILQANDPLKEILGARSREEIYGKRLDSVIRAEAVVEGSRPENSRRVHLEMTGVREDGRPSWISVNVSTVPPESPEPQYSIVMMEDLTTQKELQTQLVEAERERLEGLRLFAHSIQRAQEEERSRIARELHDDICQRLTGMKYRVEVLEEGIRPTHRRVAKQLGDVREELDRSVAEVRRISSNLRPSVLDDFGLVTALRILCKEFQSAHNIAATLHISPGFPERIDPEGGTAAYRITQQALANVARHSEATSVTLNLDIRGGALSLTIADNGRGFTIAGPDAVASRKGFGLVSMRERAELLGGHLQIDSTPGRGTAISVTIPM